MFGKQLFFWAVLLGIFSAHCAGIQAADRESLLANLRSNMVEINADFNISRIHLLTGKHGIFEPKYYNRSDVLKIMKTTRRQILEVMDRKELMTMATYVNDYFKDAQRMLQDASSPECTDCVTKNSADRAFQDISTNIIYRIAELESIAVKLYAKSKPDGAHVELYMRNHAQPAHETFTNNTFGSVYRGEYELRIDKRGHKPGRLHLDLMKNSGRLLDCTLAPQDAEDKDTVCRHLE